MQVHVVVSQPLLEGQARAESAVGGLGDAGLVEARAAPAAARSRSIWSSYAAATCSSRRRVAAPSSAPRQAGAHRRRFGRQMLGQQAEAPAPFGQRLARIREQPGNFADDRDSRCCRRRTSSRRAPASPGRDGSADRQAHSSMDGIRTKRGNAGGMQAGGQIATGR